ncbi:protein of unknown function [Pseudarcicella hirudinis]|uniref:DUF4249 domain-containing protein n=1 Tax=Pseudarcicella hirudinis TaxID=1079859 RepID=A0A1I5YKD1_9BACT|nr:DUF4249 domain-containing protein [Pseudarcicella hirudinis]SFQ44689.1 protein of unknown function [Pseudarcicella hirudinis]
MKTKLLTLLSVALAFAMTSCEDVVQLEGAKYTPVLVVDGNINNLPGNQTIKLIMSQGYFDNTQAPVVTGASVKVTDNTGKVYDFKDLKNNGEYIWVPAKADEIMGEIGKKYSLEVKTNGETYQAVSELKRVPKIDSILYQFDDASQNQTGDDKPKKGYDAQFYARDFKGEGDCYRVKTYRNGKLFNEPADIVIIYDAAFQKGAQTDGLMFILPVRRSISHQLYLENDIIKVELSSITEGNFNFWNQARQELNNGGLFSRPTSSIPTNISSVSGKKAAGWFGTSAISTFETKVDPKKARTNIK